MQLAALQQAMQERILHGESSIVALVTARDDEERRRRLHVYEHAYTARLVEALGRTYGVLRSTLGHREFDGLAGAFVRAVPSVHRSIRDYGRELGEFLSSQECGVEGRAAAELADWEWLLADVFDTTDGPVLTIDDLGRVPAERWGDLAFVPHPTLRRYSSTTNAIEIWRALKSQPDEPEAQSGRSSCAAFGSRPRVEWIAWRSDSRTLYRSMTVDEATVLDAMRSGEPFAELCVRLAALTDEESAPLHAAQLLRTWIEEGIVSAANLTAPPSRSRRGTARGLAGRVRPRVAPR